MPTYTRTITVGGVDFTGVFTTIQFTWDWEIGCDTATLTIDGLAFDDTLGIEEDDDVDIRYGTAEADRWWRGIVTEIKSTLKGQLVIGCTGTRIQLKKVIPTGVFGTKVTTAAGTDLLITEGTADTNAPGAEQNKMLVVVTSIDAEGETFGAALKSGQGGATHSTPDVIYALHTVSAADKKITVTWVAGANASGYRVYLNKSVTTPADADFTSAGGMLRFDVVGTSWVYDGSQTGDAASFPFNVAADATALTATIVATQIEDIVNHFFDNILPADISKGTVDIGTLNEDVEFMDYRESGESLDEILDGLVMLTGDVHWWVDEDNAIHFTELNGTSIKTFTLGEDTGDISNSSDLLATLSRAESADGISHVKVEGEVEFEGGEDNCRKGVTWAAGTKILVVGSGRNPRMADPRFHSIAPLSTGTVTIPNGSTKTFITDYANLAAWLADFPNQEWIYTVTDQATASDAFITRYLDKLADKTFLKVGDTKSRTFAAKSRVIILRVPGATSVTDAGKAAANWLLRRDVNPVVWSLSIEVMATLFKPGEGLITIITDQGVQYDLEIRKISYTFGESVFATFQCGDDEIPPEKEEENNKKAFKRLSFSKRIPQNWQAFNG